ncbi:MAG: UDP-N-acetyl glucosamine 2-epimerase [Elusimicrobiota bacterium]
MEKPRFAVVLGIRPELIRCSLVLNALRADPRFDVKFIWSGQHYADNLKDIFFRELGINPPEIELGARGATDAELVGSIMTRLHPVLESFQPHGVMFLGDTNTVMSCLAAAQLNIPIVHFEGCMYSYDWRMPEEKYRSIADHLADIIYAYYPEYKKQGIANGLNPSNIILVTNPIVDVLNKYYYEKKSFYDKLASDEFFSSRGIKRHDYYLMTCHRRENVHDQASFKNILNLVGSTKRRVYFAASYRPQKQLKEWGWSLPSNVTMTDPIGYQEMLALMTNAAGIITDSGTEVEEACVLQVPSIQMRKATERPQIYDAGASVKFDPTEPEKYPAETVFAKLESLRGKKWEHGLGDGKASQRIVEDLSRRLEAKDLRGHKPKDYHLDISRSYREDGIQIKNKAPLAA